MIRETEANLHLMLIKVLYKTLKCKVSFLEIIKSPGRPHVCFPDASASFVDSEYQLMSLTFTRRRFLSSQGSWQPDQMSSRCGSCRRESLASSCFSSSSPSSSRVSAATAAGQLTFYITESHRGVFVPRGYY